MPRTTSDTTTSTTGPELVTVSHPEHGTDEVPLDAAIALEAGKTGWVRDDKAKIAALTAERDALQARIDELEAADKAAEADTTKSGRKPAADKAAEADTTTPKEG